ncbi:mediator of RNA polymerase II transcription subunit 11 [Diabrotica virgifera virgifera]|uniref:Mediator of RNA polymerase II transcription subunit 11 n=1 Tax=Diabrotica virgifera virgifera TaxID=50390 RepID=A0A6P7GF91_DIAVI|nr:mediator of RNA polymerase II transcription subunit 11 [Diabrotica virgifera virgifera]
MTAPMERIQVLDSIEKDIITCLHSAGQVFVELGKEKSSLKQAENHTQMFLKTLSAVENKLTDQINYLTQVSTGQPHEGSGYASQKVLQMAWHRLEHARSRVNELERYKIKHMQGRTAQRSITAPANVTSSASGISGQNIPPGSAT